MRLIRIRNNRGGPSVTRHSVMAGDIVFPANVGAFSPHSWVLIGWSAPDIYIGRLDALDKPEVRAIDARELGFKWERIE